MKITFYQQTVEDTEIQNTQKTGNRAGQTKSTVSPGAAYAESMSLDKVFAGQNQEKGKSLIELQQDAANTNVAVQQDYMTLMANTMSAEDYAKLQEDGFDFGSMDPEETVTIVDRIKAELARSGKKIVGYTDDLDMDTLAQALGSETLAQAVATSFQEADIPLTEENVDAVAKAWNMASNLHEMTEGSKAYLVDNGLEGEIWNLYLAQSSGAEKTGTNQPAYYAEDVKGYFARSADTMSDGELAGQIDRLLVQSGREATEENRQLAGWLLKRGLPLTEENLNRLEELEDLKLPVGEEDFAAYAAGAIAEGRNPAHASLTEGEENIYEKAVRLEDYYKGSELWQQTEGNITARRQLEEVRLRMTAEVNVKLLKSGFSIDTAPMEELVEALKKAEREVAEKWFPDSSQPVEDYQTYQRTNQVISELPGLPAQVLGTFAEGQSRETLEEFHQDGKALQENYTRAKESYETLMTSPRSDLGDSIRKAFSNVDDILADLGLEPTEENRRAVRILGYNRMEMTVENLDRVQEADRQVQTVAEKMTPGAVLKMIRDGVNPLERSFPELEEYFDSLPEEYREVSESYSRFLYGLEQKKEISAEERESYIGIYRLMRQIEKSDGAAVGAVVNTGAELQLSSLLTAVRSRKLKSLDVKVSDKLGTVTDMVRKGSSIPEQIGEAFVGNLKAALQEISGGEETQRQYADEQLEQLRQGVLAEDGEAAACLARGELPANAENLLAAAGLEQDVENLLAAADRRNRAGRSRGTKAADTALQETDKLSQSLTADEAGAEPVEKESTELWIKLDEKQDFVDAYGQMTKEAMEALEETTVEEADTSLDVKSMQLAHKQLGLMSALARTEEYFLPLYVGDELTRVHLVFNRDGEEKGTVHVGINLSEESRLEADLSLNGKEVRGIFEGETEEEVTKLEKIADTFREQASENWTVADIRVTDGAERLAQLADASEETVDNAELYHLAKVFLESVRRS